MLKLHPSPMYNWMLYSSTDMVNWTDHGIIGGYALSEIDPRLDHHLLICTTELNDKAGIDRMTELIGRV